MRTTAQACHDLGIRWATLHRWMVLLGVETARYGYNLRLRMLQEEDIERIRAAMQEEASYHMPSPTIAEPNLAKRGTPALPHPARHAVAKPVYAHGDAVPLRAFALRHGVSDRTAKSQRLAGYFTSYREGDSTHNPWLLDSENQRRTLAYWFGVKGQVLAQGEPAHPCDVEGCPCGEFRR